MKVNKVVLDTSVLVIPGKDGRDIFTEDLTLFLGSYEAFVPSFIVEELKKKARTKKKKRASKISIAAKYALHNLLEKVTVEEVNKTSRSVDDSLIDYAITLDAYLCTADQVLRDIAKERGLRVIYISSKKHSKKIRSKQSMLQGG